MSPQETKKILNGLIANDKKHVRLYDVPFNFSNEDIKLGKCYFKIEESTYQILQNEVVSSTNKTASSFCIDVIKMLKDLEDNQYTSWIVENFDYLKNRIFSIYENSKDAYLYKFKKTEIVDGKDTIVVEV
ncbi:hypothetical protein [Malacoplasma iowae]|uniref:Uncharacterized protein n=2 Tax=Malacoplasma iowae TaxID=2116 RepID=A0A084U3Z8_MALIO|nr:hypothetical protein [Malacoplasma iowae]VEU61627.1 Uncharacterised protein [Mycoplasmopsis fermentans]EGZ31168.1 hypothetical protein GUU_03288 [Malacoplasma iowae 695]KFB07684.1 hypothetical protein P271_535 [Malacoplasma iowae DK-CPA]QHG90227.1 hypothetical protein EER00_05115 [Malacoplasma iowae 695]WPL36020.1 hypothetical protein QX180_01170 [Malacoplasma iowae]